MQSVDRMRFVQNFEVNPMENPFCGKHMPNTHAQKEMVNAGGRVDGSTAAAMRIPPVGDILAEKRLIGKFFRRRDDPSKALPCFIGFFGDISPCCFSAVVL